ncbi:MAG TPA: ribonuclease R, partial [Coxiellaceae bacterium]|nr:ribonuclease R [Coxiellaceae bacterium]
MPKKDKRSQRKKNSRGSRKDPHLKREAKKYDHPVASREFIAQTLESLGSPATLDQLAAHFRLRTVEEFEGLRRRLKAMERDGQLMRTRGKMYALISQLDVVAGRVLGHRDGFGFLIPDDGSPDLFLSERQMQQVFTDDRVLVSVSQSGGRRKREGRIVDILERNTQSLVGKFYQEDGLLFVSADNKTISQDILILPDGQGDAKNGQYVVVDIVQQPTKRHQAVGRIVDVLGDQLTSGMEVDLALRSHSIPFEWPEDALKEAQSLSLSLSEAERADRLDLRELPFYTIDGEDARDFDDAVFCQRTEQGWELYVAIADVSHYVKPSMALNQEALHRGNSVYFPSRVIPMLPEVLSNGLCSLKPREDRLTVVCHMLLNREGVLHSYSFHDAIIHSHERFTYHQVAALIAQPDAKDAHPLLPGLLDFYQLYQQLIRQRQARGSIEFETTETRIVFGDDGKIETIKPVVRNDAHKMIEEAMLLANVCAARHIEAAKVPCLYRVHDTPDDDRIQVLRDFLKAFGLTLGGKGSPSPLDYTHLIKSIAKRDDAHILQTVLLRSLPQAVYLPENHGHFGLAFDGYTHFTSPIRRYPDLLVHRAIKRIMSSHQQVVTDEEVSLMIQLGQHCSMTERRADRGTRDATDWLKCDFMQDKVGQTYDGVIADVTGFGLFVELAGIYVQGLVHISALKGDYYHHDT